MVFKGLVGSLVSRMRLPQYEWKTDSQGIEWESMQAGCIYINDQSGEVVQCLDRPTRVRHLANDVQKFDEWGNKWWNRLKLRLYLNRDRKLALSFAFSILTTGSMVTAMYLKDTAVYNPYVSMNYPIYVLVLVVGTVLVWRCMAAIVGVDD